MSLPAGFSSVQATGYTRFSAVSMCHGTVMVLSREHGLPSKRRGNVEKIQRGVAPHALWPRRVDVLRTLRFFSSRPSLYAIIWKTEGRQLACPIAPILASRCALAVKNLKRGALL